MKIVHIWNILGDSWDSWYTGIKFTGICNVSNYKIEENDYLNSSELLGKYHSKVELCKDESGCNLLWDSKNVGKVK